MSDPSQTVPSLQFGKACRPQRGEDRVFAFELVSRRGLLVGVADGVSSANGEAAARWIEQTMEKFAASAEKCTGASAHDLFKFVNAELADLAPSVRATGSLSTLSCGICELKTIADATVLHFEFFAVGDSPVWRVAPLANGGDLRFQASVVYESPTPREAGLVYSFVSLQAGKIEGRPHFGSVDLAEDELLILATDGVPEWRIFGEDQDPGDSADSPKLVDRLLTSPSIDDALLDEILIAYDQQKMLVDDDASIAVVRWRHLNLAQGHVHAAVEDVGSGEPEIEAVSVTAASSEIVEPLTPSRGPEPVRAPPLREVKKRQHPQAKRKRTSGKRKKSKKR